MIEIERKFLVDWGRMPHCMKPRPISQGYLSSDPNRTVRVRLFDGKAFLTIKGKSSDDGLSRYEWEQEIDPIEGQTLLGMCTQVLIKTRYHMIHQGKLWEIDVFHGRNEGLVVAEIELTSETESFNLPLWVTKEVTGNPDYYNSNLAINPYKWWLK